MQILCLASFFKGAKLLEELHAQGAKVTLITAQKVYNDDWPACIEDRYCVPDLTNQAEVMKAVAFLAKSRDFAAIVPIDEYVVDIAAWLREHMRIPGTGVTRAARFRDKLLMRICARDKKLSIPDFEQVLNAGRLQKFMDRCPSPWILKPRAESGSVKMKKIHTQQDMWETFEELGDERSHYLVEQFLPGNILHVDSLVWGGKVVFAAAHKYGRPPFNIWHEGGVFTSHTIPPKTKLYKEAIKINQDLIGALELEQGVTHAEFIEANVDGKLYFLEIAARVGGAFIDSLVLETRGVDLWREWGKIELAKASGGDYKVKASKDLQGALLGCLARQPLPDVSDYNDPEVAWSHAWDHHISMVVAAPKWERVEELLGQYQERFAEDFLAVAPPLDHPA
jgi:biotin carboxylase